MDVLVSELEDAKQSLLSELSDVKGGTLAEPVDAFSGYIVEGYEFAFLELQSTTTMQLDLVKSIKTLMVQTKQFIDGYNYAQKQM